MSSKHATMSLWHREEDGHYAAEVAGSRLEVRWHPEDEEHPRGFLWKVTTPTGLELAASEREEEIEVAMGLAEDVAEGSEKPQPTIEMGDATSPHH